MTCSTLEIAGGGIGKAARRSSRHAPIFAIRGMTAEGGAGFTLD